MLLSAQQSYSQWSAVMPLTPCGADSSLYSVTCSDHENCFAIGENGTTYRSVDGRVSFKQMNVNTNVDLYKIRFTSAHTGYICGDKGTFAMTTDSGTTWKTVQLSGYEQRALYSMEWMTPDTGFIAGGASAVAHGQVGLPDGFILRTTDAGISWINIYSDQTNFFWSLGIQRRTDGGVIPHVTSYGPLNGGRIQFTTDYGTTWVIASAQLPFLPHEISFVSNNGIVVGGNPFDFTASPGIAYQVDQLHWNFIPDTLAVKGFAWSVEAFTSDTSVAKAQPVSTVLIGLNSGRLLKSRGKNSEFLKSITIDTAISPCALYDFAVHRLTQNNGWKWETIMLAAGSGHGLFITTKDVIVLPDDVENVPDKQISNINVYPNPLILSEEHRIHVNYSLENSESSYYPLRLFIIDQLGRTINDSINPDTESGVHSFQFDVSIFPNGLYHIVFQRMNTTVSKSFIIIR